MGSHKFPILSGLFTRKVTCTGLYIFSITVEFSIPDSSPLWSVLNEKFEQVEIELMKVYRAAVIEYENYGLQFGGRRVGGEFSSDLVKIELLSTGPVAAKIEPRGRSLPELASSSIAVVDGYVYIIGGLRENGSISDKIFKV